MAKGPMTEIGAPIVRTNRACATCHVESVAGRGLIQYVARNGDVLLLCSQCWADRHGWRHQHHGSPNWKFRNERRHADMVSRVKLMCADSARNGH